MQDLVLTPITPPAVLGRASVDFDESYCPGPGVFPPSVMNEFAVVLDPIVIPEFFLETGSLKYYPGPGTRSFKDEAVFPSKCCLS